MSVTAPELTASEAYDLWAMLGEINRERPLRGFEVWYAEAAMLTARRYWTKTRGKTRAGHLRRWRDLQAMVERSEWAANTQKWTEPQSEAPPVAEDAG